MTTKAPNLDDRLKAANLAKAEAEAELARLQVQEMQETRAWDLANAEERRVFMFNGPVADLPVTGAINTLSRWHAHSPREPITFRIISGGGVVEEGLALYDYLAWLGKKLPLTTVGMGVCASMAGVILQAGERRLLAPNCHLLIHELAGVIIGKPGDVEDETAYMKLLQGKLLDILSRRSTLAKADVAERWKRRDWWMTARTAVRYGFADAVGVR